MNSGKLFFAQKFKNLEIMLPKLLTIIKLNTNNELQIKYNNTTETKDISKIIN